MKKTRAQRQREWREKNIELCRARDKSRYERDKVKRLEAAKIHGRKKYARDPALGRVVSLEKSKKFRSSRAKRLLANARDRARKNSLPFDLTPEWVEQRLCHGCEATGLEFRDDVRAGPFSASIDRVIPGGGYTMSNCMVVSLIYNTCKLNFSIPDVEKFCGAFLNQQSNRRMKDAA